MSGLGTIVGIICGILINVLLIELFKSFPYNTSDIFLWISFPILGAVEGIFLGWFQYYSLKERFPDLKLTKWIIMTCAGLSISWTLGMLSYWYISTFSYIYLLENLPNLKEIIFILLWVILTGGLGAVLGYFQMLGLRKYVNNAGKWVTANFLSWPVMIPLMGLAYFISEAVEYNSWVVFITYISLSFFAFVLVGLILGLFFIKLSPVEEK